ncbi:type II toxin-antitoxin system VapC family toxin [Methylomonas sp. UP202]|uniref:type II toxin-antitoxin system VapC family toxin n=1 Tax=Methylomonas sp. UP202 TaxID=3040943 RepID=UPI002479D210|nr:type II toxin-antitoxin system VapC family toxin [Methylomonas sp. UP202]WGS84834.1 type II toxin-antitoxin system VapC family toxin [Methylomonas sp. UP202]
MKFVVDTCGWIEWLTDGILADRFAPYLADNPNLIVPTSIQYELHKWICRERNEVVALQVVELTQQAEVVVLSEPLALLASQVSQQYKLSFADAIIYATAQQQNAELVTADDHFEKLSGVRYFFKK